MTDWLRPKAWTIDEAHMFLHTPAILNNYVGLISHLFPAYTLPAARGGHHVGAKPNISICLNLFLSDFYVLNCTWR
jgi:hypothetical protein